MYTFDILHSSDPGKGQREVSNFFNKDELNQKKLTVEDKLNIIINKLLKNQASKKQYFSNSRARAPLDNASDINQLFLIIIKPEGLSYFSTIATELLASGINIVAAKTLEASKKKIKQLYKKYADQYFFKALVEYVAEREIYVIAAQGKHNDLLACRKQLREIFDPQFIKKAINDLNTLPQENTKYATIDKKTFIREYCLTFDTIHCSIELT